MAVNRLLITFEEYSVGETLHGQDGWDQYPAFGPRSRFRVTTRDDNAFVRCTTTDAASIVRAFSPETTAYELRWRWRSVTDGLGAKVAFGPARLESQGATGNWLDYGARVLMDRDRYMAYGVDWEDNTGWPAPRLGEWSYIRLVYNPSNGDFWLYHSYNPDRVGEQTLVKGAPGSPGADRGFLLKCDTGDSGAQADIDDIRVSEVSVSNAAVQRVNPIF